MGELSKDLDVYRLEFQVETRAQAMGTQFRKGIFLMVQNLATSHHEEPPCEISQGGFRHLAKYL